MALSDDELRYALLDAVPLHRAVGLRVDTSGSTPPARLASLAAST